MDPLSIIDVLQISKSYNGEGANAVNKLSFSIVKNEIFGLLGPNGAGKTTTISMLCGLFQPDSGSIIMNGYNLKTDLSLVKSIIGVVPQDIALYPTLTGRENLIFYGTMYGVSKQKLKERIEFWLAKLELNSAADKRVESYSGGMKRRINLICGLLHDPSILILDEPTVGVDVQSRSAIMEHLKELNASGVTIIYTSHHMEEAEKFCSDVAIIDHGEIVARGKPKHLIESHESCTNLEDVFLKLTNKKLRN
jgi:ABC-2 type transport system ATP-binding protein